MRTVVIVSLIAALFYSGKPVASQAAQSCAQINDRVFGSDGRGGDAAQFRSLKAKIDEETRSGQTQAVARDRAEYAQLATSILASAKTMQAGGCKARVVANAKPGTDLPSAGNGAQQGVTNPARVLSNGGAGVTVTRRSAHGCVGFNGLWQTSTGPLRIRDGAGALGSTWFTGNVSGDVFRGGWSDPRMGSGSFVLTLAQDGDSVDAAIKNANGSSGAYMATCIGP